jgi:hypothetical protein
LEAELLVETVGGLPRGARGEIDAAGALLLRQAKGRHRQGGADALAACVLVDDDILDPRSQPRGKREDDEGEHADDGALAAGDEQGDGLVIDGPGEVLGAEWRRRAGQLRKQAPAGLHDFIGRLADASTSTLMGGL